jgi:hypothetical protein
MSKIIHSNLLHHALLLAVGLALMSVGIDSKAITITYVNAGSSDSRVFVGFANDASGYTTSDLVMDPAAYSRNDTAFGPLPAPGNPANFDAKAYAAAELGTNLNCTSCYGVRSVFAPLLYPSTYFQAHGETLAPTGTYSSNAFSFSGDTTSTSPTAWIVHVDPSGAEVAGTPTQVMVTGSIAGFVSVAGASSANALWNVMSPSNGTVMSGTANQSTVGSTNFSDSGTLIFTIPLGSTFELLVNYDLSTSGSGGGANSTSEVSQSLVEVSAVILPPVAPVVVSVSFPGPSIGGTTVVSPAGPFHKNRTIPLRVQVRDADGNLLSDDEAAKLDARIVVYPTSEKGDGKPVELKPMPQRKDDTFRYNAGSNQFFYNLSTYGPAWSAGQTYRIEVRINGKPLGEGFFALR